MKSELRCHKNGERGMALISALLATTMVLALGMAIVFSATSDTMTTKTARFSEQAFFAADAGVGIARRAIAQALDEKLNELRATVNTDTSGCDACYQFVASTDTTKFPTVQLLPDPDSTAGQSSAFYQSVLARASALASLDARNQKLSDLNQTSFTVTFNSLSGAVSLTPTTPTRATEVFVLRYSFKVTGKTAAGGTATVNETGRLSTSVVLTMPEPDKVRNFSFAGFAAFFDNGDTAPSSFLAAGTFTGPVHTNTHFCFDQSRTVNFGGIVSQYDPKIRIWKSGATSTAPTDAIPTKDIAGINLNENLTPPYKKTDNKVPLPKNNFSQEFAVINGTGITDTDPATGMLLDSADEPAVMPTDSHGNKVSVFDSSGRVTATALSLNLRDASNNKPGISSGQISDGVYISSDGSKVTGAGIYVKGTASDIQLYADNGDQVYVIKQSIGGTTYTTTVRTNFSTKKTTVSSLKGSKSNGSTTYDGVFTDRGDKSNAQPGGMLFVDGDIQSLRGGIDSSNSRKAIASNTRLTIAAQGDITVTGDLVYTNEVASSVGDPVQGIDSMTNVLGIFTNNGNVNLAPNSTYVKTGLSLEMDAAVVAFNSNTSDDNGNIEGSITYTGSSTPGTNDIWRLVGSRVQSNINNIGYNKRNIYYDQRFASGTFAPPFFPGTNYQFSPVPSTGGLRMDVPTTPFAVAMSWFRDNN